MEYDNPVFYKHFKKPFTWTTMKWPRSTNPYQSCDVSDELAKELGWRRGNGVYPRDLIMGPLRLRVMFIRGSCNALVCERASGPREEFIRAVLLRIKELVTSPFYYYFGKKRRYG